MCGTGIHNTLRGLACSKPCGWYREYDGSAGDVGDYPSQTALHVGADQRRIQGDQMKQERMTKVTRSFSLKLNNQRVPWLNKFETLDLFIAQSSKCSVSEKEELSAFIYAFCKQEVLKSANELIAEPDPLAAMRESIARRIAEAEATLAANGEIATGPVVVEVQKPTEEGPTATTVSTPSPEAPKGGSDQLGRFVAVAERLAQVSQRDPKAIKENVIVPFVHAFVRQPERKRWMKAHREEYEAPLRFLESLCKSAGNAMKVVQEPAAMGDRLQVGYDAVQRTFSATPELQEAAEDVAIRKFPEDGGAALCEWKMDHTDKSTSALIEWLKTKFAEVGE